MAKKKYRCYAVVELDERGKMKAHPCLFGSLSVARDNRDDDESIVEVEYQIVRVAKRVVSTNLTIGAPARSGV